MKTLSADENHASVHHGRTVIGRARSGRKKGSGAVRADGQFVGTKLDRLTRSISDAHGIVSELAQNSVALSLGGSVYDPTDPTGKSLFNVPKRVIEVEADVIRMRTRKGKQVAKAKERLRGKRPSFSPAQEQHRVTLYRSGVQTATLAHDSGAARSTAYRGVERVGEQW